MLGVTGDARNTLLEAIRKNDRFGWIGVRHEEDAAYAAYAQAELTGGIGVRAGTVGPGASHLTINKARGFGLCKSKEAILGLKSDHSQGKGWRGEFMANLRQRAPVRAARCAQLLQAFRRRLGRLAEAPSDW